MGGDNSPLSNIVGSKLFLDNNPNSDTDIIFVGNKSLIEEEIKKNQITLDYKRIDYLDVDEVITMSEEKPAQVFKNKPNSSLVKSIQLVKDNEADAIISAGNTAALLSSALFILGKIDGIKRPALFAFIPSENGNFLICDVGANSTAKPNHLLQFGKMASIYMKFQMKINQPKIGLLNIGSEENKGNELSKSSFNLLSKNLENFIGNIESRYIFDGKADIILCDGFTGNIVLKLIEGMAQYNLNLISSKLKLDDNQIVKDIKKIYDYEQYGATPILGVKGLVFKAHGSSSGKGIKNALKTAYRVSQIDLINKFKKSK